MQTMNDKDFLAEAQKAKLSVEPISGDEVARIVVELLRDETGTSKQIERYHAAKVAHRFQCDRRIAGN